MPLRKPSNSIVAKASTSIIAYQNTATKYVSGSAMEVMRRVRVAIGGPYRIEYLSNQLQCTSQVYVNGVPTGPLRTSLSGDNYYSVDTVLPANAIVEIKYEPYGGYANSISNFRLYADVPIYTDIL